VPKRHSDAAAATTTTTVSQADAPKQTRKRIIDEADDVLMPNDDPFVDPEMRDDHRPTNDDDDDDEESDTLDFVRMHSNNITKIRLSDSAPTTTRATDSINMEIENNDSYDSPLFHHLLTGMQPDDTTNNLLELSPLEKKDAGSASSSGHPTSSFLASRQTPSNNNNNEKTPLAVHDPMPPIDTMPSRHRGDAAADDSDYSTETSNESEDLVVTRRKGKKSSHHRVQQQQQPHQQQQSIPKKKKKQKKKKVARPPLQQVVRATVIKSYCVKLSAEGTYEHWYDQHAVSDKQLQAAGYSIFRKSRDGSLQFFVPTIEPTAFGPTNAWIPFVREIGQDAGKFDKLDTRGDVLVTRSDDKPLTATLLQKIAQKCEQQRQRHESGES
jgi:hypothetical protein